MHLQDYSLYIEACVLSPSLGWLGSTLYQGYREPPPYSRNKIRIAQSEHNVSPIATVEGVAY